MKKLFASLLAFIATLSVMTVSAAYTHSYDTVPGDPLNTLIYTLPNGLKVFMTVNRDEPRIQTYIPVRVGSKNDPAETTGLAHYFEHLMFKGTDKFGTRDYAAEKPLLDQIENLFEVYRVTADSAERARIYARIDSVSYAASLLAIPNEYDKLMNGIGAVGTNAFTSQDVTCYVENIPSNRVEEWAIVQADRFKNPVLRGFHTELETIYEEKNLSLTDDYDKTYDALLAGLYPSHPYGRQTVLGSQEHLKNPSIRNVRNYHSQWYLPNNMAICMSGDFNPDAVVDIIEKYFGDMKADPSVESRRLAVTPETALTSPDIRTIYGLDSEMVTLGWRIPGATHDDQLALDILSSILSNGKTGLIDKNMTTPQKVLRASAFVYPLVDHGAVVMTAQPKAGQSLDETRELLLRQIDLLRAGDFDESLVKAVVTNEKLMIQRMLEKNENRAMVLANAFYNGFDWGDYVDRHLAQLDKITKKDIVEVANRYLGRDNYVAVNKLTGEDTSIKKIPKAKLTPIATNREYASQFLTDVLGRPVKPIEPHFVDFGSELTRTAAKDGAVEVLYTENTTNDIFKLIYVFDFGYYAQPDLTFAGELVNLFGTGSKSVQEIKDAFYALGCSFFISVGPERTYIVISGLDENAEAAANLAEEVIADAKADNDTWNKYVDRVEKARADNKLNQAANFGRLRSYVIYGTPENNPSLIYNTPVDSLRASDPSRITDAVAALPSYRHRAIYYGPRSKTDAVALIDATHHTGDATPLEVPATPVYKYVEPTETVFFIAPYDSEQLYMAQFNSRGEMYDPAVEPSLTIFDEYFDGSMNSIVFQEMRESRSLAYGASASMSSPSYKDRPYYVSSYIATQNDKMVEAIDAFNEIINETPLSQAAFALAKDGLEARIRTARTIHDDIAWAWIDAQDHGIDYDTNRPVFEKLETATLDDISAFQQKYMKGRTYHYAILGRIEDLDLDALRSRGRVVILSTEDIFGY